MSTDAINELVQKAIKLTHRNEEWKYTRLAPMQLSSRFSLALRNDSLLSPRPLGGVTIEPLTDELIANDEEVRNALGSAAPVDATPFVALNSELYTNGVVVRVAKNTVVTDPIEFTITADATEGDVLHTARILVLAGESSKVDIVQSHQTVGTNTALVVTVTELILAPNSEVSFTKIDDDNGDGRHIAYVGGHVQRDAVLRTSVFCLGGTFQRNDLNIKLLGKGANAYLDGVSVLTNKEFADNHTVVDHCVAHCHSEELYKGVYNDSSVGVFNGKIYVRPDAQKTTAYQSNHSLLLSDNARINAKPQLEIWADDVKCSHGASTGQLNEEAIFYLRSRGIAEDEARSLMTYAFAAEVVDRLKDQGLKSQIEKRVASKLGSQPFDRAWVE